MLCTVNLQISREINVPVINFKKYLMQNYTNNCTNRWKVSENTGIQIKIEIKFYKFIEGIITQIWVIRAWKIEHEGYWDFFYDGD